MSGAPVHPEAPHDAREVAPVEGLPPSQTPVTAPPPVVVLGAGFAGLEVAKALGRAGVATTVIDRRNHHVFQPLLYQVATAALSADDVAHPVRSILSALNSVEVILGDVQSIDLATRRVICRDGQSFPYSFLVLATGSRTSHFGHADWARVAPGLKSIEDATAIRARVLLAFEAAERCTDPVEQRRLMTVAVIGGGPTGVEMAGAIAELSRFSLARDFRRIRPENARVILVEAGPRLLAGFDQTLSDYALRRLLKLGVEVRTDAPVEHIAPRELRLADELLPVGQVIWAAGVAASPLAAEVARPADKSGRIAVRDDLSVPGAEGVFALGDLARLEGPDGTPLPGLAQVAKQQGRHLGAALARHIADGAPIPPFAYRTRGNTAIVGRHAAVYEFGRFTLKGWPAWALWAVVHVYLLVGFQQRLLVSIRWLWRYLTYERGARIIPGPLEDPGRGGD